MYIESKDKPTRGMLAGIALNTTFAVWSCGFALSGNTDVVDVLSVRLDWGDDTNRNNTAISSTAVFGLALGAILSKLFTSWGRRRTILLMNLIITIITIPFFFTDNFWVLTFMRCILGFASAVIVNASSLYQSETLPSEVQSTIGVNINFGIVFGIYITYCFGLLLPKADEVQAAKDDYLWRISYSLQLIPVAITTAFWLLWFKTEPILFLISKSESQPGSATYDECLAAIAIKHEAVTREEQIEVFNRLQLDLSQNTAKQEEAIGYYKALFDPQFNRATIICMILSLSTQLTGINPINIYSTQIYQSIQDESGGDGGISPRIGTVLNGTAQVIACCISPFVAKFKFRTIINGGFLSLGTLMGIVSILASQKLDTLLVVFMMLFLFMFQLTLGTYSWVYLGQVASDEGLSIGVGVLWGVTLILSLITNTMFDKLGNWGTFLFFAVCCILSSIFFFFFLKETQGLDRGEQQLIYAPNTSGKTQGTKTLKVVETEETLDEELLNSKPSKEVQNSIGGTIITADSNTSSLKQ